VDLANDMGVDPIAALSIFAIESDFGRNNSKSSAGAIGSMQVMPAQFVNLKTWFADPKNRAAIESAYTLGGKVNTAQVDYILRKINTARQGSTEGQLTMGMAQLIYNKAIDLDKNLWGAGYQGNANKVKTAGQPLAVDDGNITNSDYNRAYVDIYNDIITNHGAKLVDTYGSLATIDLAQIQGTGVGKPLLKQVPGIKAPVIVQKGTTAGTTRVAQGTLTDTTAGTTTSTKVNNTGRSMNVQPQNVTDTGAGKDGSVVTQNLKKPEDGAKRIQKLTDVPNRLGFEFQKAMENRNILSQTLQNMQRAGLTGINRPEYQKGIADMMLLDSMLYVMQSEDALMSFEMSGNPARLNSVMDAFTGGGALIQARNDGKFDFIRPDGTAIPGLEGLSAGQVKLNARTIFDQKYRQSIEAATAKKNEAIFESKLKQIEEAAKINAQAQANMIEKLVETQTNMEMKVEDSGRLIITSKGGMPQFAFQKQFVEEETPDGDTIEIEKYVAIPIDSFDFGVGNSYMAEIAKIGKGQ